MRQTHSTSKEGKPPRTKKEEPLEEKILKPRQPNRKWKGMGNAEVLDYATRLIKERKITCKNELDSADRGLYVILRDRELLPSLVFEPKEQAPPIPDEKILEMAAEFMRESGIAGRTAFVEKNHRLFRLLKDRGLLDIALPIQARFWASMSDAELVSAAQEFINNEKIQNAAVFKRSDSGFHEQVRQRGLMHLLVFEREGKIAFSEMNDEELLSFADRVVLEKKIGSKIGLHEALPGQDLYSVLSRRKLLSRVNIQGKRREWSRMPGEDLLLNTREIMGSKGITTETQLRTAEPSLYRSLEKKGLLGSIEFHVPAPDVGSMPDAELSAYLKGFIQANQIQNRTDFRRISDVLYRKLRNRSVFNELLPKKEEMDWSGFSDADLLEHAQKFIDENRVRNHSHLMELEPKLCDVLYRRKLGGNLSFIEKRQKTRSWRKMSDDELVAYSRDFMSREGIPDKDTLKDRDGGLHEVLRRRKLLEAVFADLEASKEAESRRNAVDAVLEVLEEMGDSK